MSVKPCVRCCLPFSIVLLASLAQAGDVWLFLKDGRAGVGDPSREPVRIAFADGIAATITKDFIQFQRTQEQVDQGVQAIFQELLRGENFEANAKRFKVLQAAAIPKVLEYLMHEDVKRRLVALYALQYCWSPQAQDPVLKALEDKESDVRKGAVQVLIRQVPAKKAADRLLPLADG